MDEPFIGSIIIFAGTFAPRGWALCNGQLMSISQNSALFSILGTTYGGDGIQTFALPDLRGRTPIGVGNGPGLTPRSEGEMSGSESVTLTIANMPAHNHAIATLNGAGDQSSPAGHFPAASSASSNNYSSRSDSTLAAQAVSIAGSNQPIPTMPPFLAINYIIALEGIYPSRP